MKLMSKVAITFATLALAACAGMGGGGGKSVDVKLSGGEEVPPVSTQASGSGSFTVAADGAVSGSVTTSGMNGVAAHIHQGARGQNGPVIVPLTKSGDSTWSTPPGAKLNEAQMSAFKAGNLYVNVHTPQNKGGEIRAQLNP
jgi:hypothetical protein